MSRDQIEALLTACEPVVREFKREPLASSLDDSIIVEVPMAYGEMRAFVAAVEAVWEVKP